MDTTVSSTLASTRQGLDRHWHARAGWQAGLRALAVWWLCGALVLGLGLIRPAHAVEPTILQQSLQHNADGLFLTASLGLTTSPEVEDALLKGVPLYFVWEAEVMRDRWYWTDKRVAHISRTWRLVYQPLTRRWRLSLASPGAAASGAGLQYALHQNFESLDDALANVGRVLRWKVADASQLDASSDERVIWRFRLDLGLLPRPFQIGVANQDEWDINVQRGLPVPAKTDTAVGVPASGDPEDPDATAR